jgi:hypothetical protein
MTILQEISEVIPELTTLHINPWNRVRGSCAHKNCLILPFIPFLNKDVLQERLESAWKILHIGFVLDANKDNSSRLVITCSSHIFLLYVAESIKDTSRVQEGKNGAMAISSCLF